VARFSEWQGGSLEQRSDGWRGGVTPFAGAPGSNLDAALAAAEGLLLYREVLADAPGRAFLGLLSALSSGVDTRAIHQRASELFVTLATTSATGLAAPGDAWQRHLGRRIVLDDNPFSQTCQRVEFELVPAGLRQAAQRDLRALGQLYSLDGRQLGATIAEHLGEAPWADLDDLGPDGEPDPLAAQFALTDPAEWSGLAPALAERYRVRGVGQFAEFRAFRWARSERGGHLLPIARVDPIAFDDLIGYADQRAIVRRNTEHFLGRRPANNLLLYGERGTGKSSTVKALLNAYAERGLRLVEVAKSSLGDFSEIVGTLAARPERFIIFIDDLSFDENETGYTELKAILEGGVEVRPENVILYATSNRRHLVLERFGDRAMPDDEIHAQDTLQEKLSLADRFGVTVIFLAPDQEQYLAIVAGLVKRRGLPIDDATLRRRALQWATWNNGRSGRTARQFVDDLTAELRHTSTA
jgi:predicted AAA+ superfamily ATPase